MNSSKVTIDKHGYYHHPELSDSFGTMLRGCLAVMDGSAAEIFQNVARQMFDPSTEAIVCGRPRKSRIPARVKSAVRNLPGSFPYYVSGNNEEFFVIITTDPDHLAKCLRTSEHYKVGQMTPEELAVYKVHRS